MTAVFARVLIKLEILVSTVSPKFAMPLLYVNHNPVKGLAKATFVGMFRLSLTLTYMAFIGNAIEISQMLLTLTVDIGKDAESVRRSSRCTAGTLSSTSVLLPKDRCIIT